MKTSLFYILLVSLTICNGQSINKKTESVKIYGNCEMCKSTIEKAGNMKNQSNVDWDTETKMATISYDSLKTTKEEILKRIALAGYDSDTFLAPDDTYANLAGCCQYERARKEIVSIEEPKMEMTVNHLEHTKSETMEMPNSTKTEASIERPKMEMPKIKTETVNTDYLKRVFDNYFEVKNALVQSDGNLTSTKATNLVKSLNAVKMNELKMDVHMVWMKIVESLKKESQAISETNAIEKQRGHLDMLSKDMYTLLKVSKYEEPVYYQYCPMKDSNWLSKEETIKNPYYGSQMLSCGKTVETIQE